MLCIHTAVQNLQSTYLGVNCLTHGYAGAFQCILLHTEVTPLAEGQEIRQTQRYFNTVWLYMVCQNKHIKKPFRKKLIGIFVIKPSVLMLKLFLLLFLVHSEEVTQVTSLI